MNMSVEPGSPEYFEQLGYYRDQALENSYWVGRRRKLGSHIVCGTVQAQWESDSGGSVHLRQRGLQITGNITLGQPFPTMLRLPEYSLEAGMTINREFYVDIEGSQVEVFNRIIVDGLWREKLRADFFQMRERQLGLTHPSEEDLIDLHYEMQRGACGLFKSRYDAGIEGT